MEYKSHDLRLLRLGKGKLYFDRYDDNGLPTGLRLLGNAPVFVMTPSEETYPHYTAMEEVKVLDTILTISQMMTLKFTLEEFDRENLRMAMFGKPDSWTIHGMTSPFVEGYLEFVPTNAQGPKYHGQFWKVRMKPTGDIGMIDDTTIGKMDFEAVTLNDVDNHPISPYFDLTLMAQS